MREENGSGKAFLTVPLLLVLLSSSCWSAEKDPLEQARAAYKDGDRTQALGFYQAYLQDHADDYAALKEYTLTLGEQWAFAGGDRSAIIENLNNLYRERPNDREVQGLLAVMLVSDGQDATEAGRFEEAEAALRRAIAVNPESGLAQYHLGNLYDSWQRPERAFDQYRASAAKQPEIPDLYLRLGRAYLERGDADRAIATLGMVLRARISTYLVAEAHCSLAQAYAAKGLEQETREHLRQATADCQVEAGKEKR
ncbi:MAG: tetratricopeptide repeat protein [Acidobacteriota bacterium]